MATEKKTETGKTQDLGQAELQKFDDEAEKKGFIGKVPDGPPNEHFTLKGQAKK